MLFPPSPKSHIEFKPGPEELFVNSTARSGHVEVLLAVKFATGFEIVNKFVRVIISLQPDASVTVSDTV